MMAWLCYLFSDDLRVSAIGAELVEDEGVEQAHVAGHLLHAPQLSLLLCVRELHHQAR